MIDDAGAQRLASAMRQVTLTADEAAQAIQRMAPVLAEAWRQVMELARHDRNLRFRLWVIEQPRWQRPFMRLAFRIERLVLR